MKSSDKGQDENGDGSEAKTGSEKSTSRKSSRKPERQFKYITLTPQDFTQPDDPAVKPQSTGDPMPIQDPYLISLIIALTAVGISLGTVYYIQWKRKLRESIKNNTDINLDSDLEDSISQVGTLEIPDI